MIANRRRTLGWLGAAAAVPLGLAGCASDRPKGAALEPLGKDQAWTPVWERRVGPVEFPASLAQQAGRLAVLDNDGSVSVYDAATGRGVWRTESRVKPAAGVGFDGERAALVSRGHELVVLDGQKELWRRRLDSQVVTAPLVAGERVFVLSVDRSVRAFDALDGRYLWQFRRTGEPLTLTQPGVLSAYRDTLLVGQGSRWVALDPVQGTVRWESALSVPRGTNEVERLADLIGPAARDGSVFCARAFQNAVGCVDAERGTSVVSVPMAGIQPVGADAEMLYAADAADRVVARRRSGGETVWSTERLQHRDLSGLLAVPAGVVAGDGDGQIHLLDRATGRTLRRAATDGSRIVALVATAPDRVVALTRRGSVLAFAL